MNSAEEKSPSSKLNSDNFLNAILQFRDRQAGVGLVFDNEHQKYFYNAYCIETKLMEELFTCEYEFLDDALVVINSEFGQWELRDFAEAKPGCGSCAAKSHN